MIYKDINLLKIELDKLRKNSKKIIWTNGCFDILHPGHIETFKKCKKLADILIVGINGKDSPYWKTKPKRPINDEKYRTKMLDAIKYIDYIYIFNDKTPALPVSILKPNIVLKGGDYLSNSVKKVVNDNKLNIEKNGLLDLTKAYSILIKSEDKDWKNEKGYMSEGEICVKNGGKIILVPIVLNYSTTNFIDKIKNLHLVV